MNTTTAPSRSTRQVGSDRGTTRIRASCAEPAIEGGAERLAPRMQGWLWEVPGPWTADCPPPLGQTRGTSGAGDGGACVCPHFPQPQLLPWLRAFRVRAARARARRRSTAERAIQCEPSARSIEGWDVGGTSAPLSRNPVRSPMSNQWPRRYVPRKASDNDTHSIVVDQRPPAARLRDQAPRSVSDQERDAEHGGLDGQLAPVPGPADPALNLPAKPRPPPPTSEAASLPLPILERGAEHAEAIQLNAGGPSVFSRAWVPRRRPFRPAPLSVHAAIPRDPRRAC
jgi:hypothetical protein